MFPRTINTRHCLTNKKNTSFFFDVLLTVHLSIFISVINQLDAQNCCFTVNLFHATTCFEHMCSSSGGQNCITQPLVSSHLVHETAAYRCDDTRGCVMQFWPPDDEHMCSKHVVAWNKFTVKQQFGASSWLITEINFFVGLLSICNFFFVPCKIVYRFAATNCFFHEARTHRRPAVTGGSMLLLTYGLQMLSCFIMIFKIWKTIKFLVLYGRRAWRVAVERCWNTCMLWREKFVLAVLTEDWNERTIWETE